MVPSALTPARDELFPYFERLWPDYRDYCLSVSRRGMAMSIESCSYLWWLCDQVGARSVADLGSGFTSFTLRTYAANAGQPVVVESVDDSRHWLGETSEYLTGKGLDASGLQHHERWFGSTTTYDVIVHDFASGDTREEWMTYAVERLNPDGVIMFDDAQHAGHHHEMANVCRVAGLTFVDIYHQTVDEVGRFAGLGVR